MDISSFLTSLGTSFLIFLVLMMIFAWLQRKPSNEVVYYPNRILRGLDPWEGRAGRTRNPFAWIREALGTNEEDLVTAAGVDAAVYFVFLSSVLTIMVFSGVLLLPVLLPVARTDHNIILKQKSNTSAFSDLDMLAMGNVQEKSSRLWAFLLGTYWVTLVTYFVLWKAYKHVSDLRASALSGPGVRPEQYTILVRDIPRAPEDQTRKEQVDSYFKALHPDSFYRSMVITDNKEVNKIWKKLETYRKKLDRAEAVYAESKTSSKPEGTKPTMKTGLLGLIGTKVDTIDHCNEEIKDLLLKLETEQKITLREKQQNAALVFFNSRPATASASQTLHAQQIDTWTVMEAPEPRQLVWTNLPIKFHARQIRQYVVYGIVFLTVVFYMVPITAISAFTTLSNLKKLLPFLKKAVDQPEVKSVLEAYLPQIALIVFLALLPKFLMMLSKNEGIPSGSHIVRSASGKFFYFTIFNVFLGVTLSGTLFASLKTVLKHPDQIIPMLGKSLPGNANFFITLVALKFFVGYGLELSRLVPLIIFHIKKKYLCKTEAELKEAWAPGDLSYATRVPNDLLVVTIVLCYSVIAPIIIPFGVAYFGLGWLVLRNQALKVYVPAYESYGRMWPHMQARILAAIIIYQLTMIGYFSVKKFYYVPILIPLPILTLIFAYLCSKRFYLAFKYTPLEVACRNAKETPNMDMVFRAYIPPALVSDKFDDTEDQFEDAQSEASRTVPV
ncbi:hypothetical protein QJS04_geneDACA017710 [Acorus gramineus]|uniref:CSC1-like protein ERD4 n=1 Tax=Acorus gramineus TaxID=55184 RepID=A0AAV9BT25_ACOGR|nr:hypothetical protein QJS04_geneDACA017710 [Acorus gramineus]